MNGASSRTDPRGLGTAIFPAGLHNAFLFAGFNALSYQIVLNSPMVLYAKSLGASATVLGIVAGMMPLLVIFQIPAANHINRVGYKRFVYAGWGIRVLFIFGLALVPLAGFFLDAKTRLALLLLLLFCFNLSRGISSCAWLPWITVPVPPAIRGKYLVRDAAVQNFGSFLTYLVAAGVLGGATHSWQFSVLFGFSAIMGGASLFFLKRIPDVPISEPERVSKARVPWLEMMRYPPFLKQLRMVMAWSVAYGGITAFTVAYLRMEVGMSETRIMLVTAVAFLGGLSSLGFLGHSTRPAWEQTGIDVLFCGVDCRACELGDSVGWGTADHSGFITRAPVYDGTAGGFGEHVQQPLGDGYHSTDGPQPLLCPLFRVEQCDAWHRAHWLGSLD